MEGTISIHYRHVGDGGTSDGAGDYQGGWKQQLQGLVQHQENSTIALSIYSFEALSLLAYLLV
jgi:hypothetical protein